MNSFSNANFLIQWGWSNFFANQITTRDLKGLRLARIINSEKNFFLSQIDEDESILASISGRLRHSIEDEEKWPAVGDWALLQVPDGGGTALVVDILDRSSCLRRKVAGRSADSQILATNFETVLIATSSNDDFNLNRLERYLTLAWDSGAEPVIVLTKSDLVEEPEKILEELRSRFVGVSTIAVSTKTPDSIYALKTHLGFGKTAVLVGSSGVGKSSLVNVLMGTEVLKTQEIREADSKGRHTTTARYLKRTSWGGLIIDSPGMREIQMLDHDTGLDKNFEDIAAIMLSCRFSNCQHDSEPGCAVKNAMEMGILDNERWEAFLKLQREVRHSLRKQNKAIASEDKKKWKQRHMDHRQRKKWESENA